MTNTTYTTRGNVRGECGHSHRSIRTAANCVRRDSSGCASQGGYSDRFVVRADGTRMSEHERDEVGYYLNPHN